MPAPRHASQRPMSALPSFVNHATGRLFPEVHAAKRSLIASLLFGLAYGYRAIRYPISPRLMAASVRTWMATDVLASALRITSPTLLITGEPHLDRVVPVASTLEYLEIIKGSRHVTLANTGHVGVVSKPAEFTKLIEDFNLELGV